VRGVAPDDLPDPRAIQANRSADISERKPFSLSLGEGFTPSLTRRFAVELELLLSRLHGSAGSFTLGSSGIKRA
jgi:hypothetical protein